jgi:RNA polymerase-interacting CarD/CdnL/TRCF family regulator
MTIRRLDELADKLKQMQRSEGMQAAEQFQQMLKGLKGSSNALAKDLNMAVAKGDFKKAADMVRDLQDKLASGDLSPEHREELAKQLQDLASQLNSLADKDDAFSRELERNGLDPSLAKLDEETLREALQKQGLSEEQIEKMLQDAAACRSACKSCRGLGQKMSQCGGSGAKSGELAELAEMLDALEAMQQEMALCKASLDAVDDAIAMMGRPGGAQSIGLTSCNGGGGGIGGSRAGTAKGAQAADDFQDTIKKDQLAGTIAPGKTNDGPAVASWYFNGPQVTGESKRELRELIQAGRDSSAEAIEENEIPRRYEGALKRYYGDMEQTSTGPDE